MATEGCGDVLVESSILVVALGRPARRPRSPSALSLVCSLHDLRVELLDQLSPIQYEFYQKDGSYIMYVWTLRHNKTPH